MRMPRGAGQIDGGPRADHDNGMTQAHDPVRNTGRGEKGRCQYGDPPGQDHQSGQVPAHHPPPHQRSACAVPQRPWAGAGRFVTAWTLRPSRLPRALTDMPGLCGCSPGSCCLLIYGSGKFAGISRRLRTALVPHATRHSAQDPAVSASVLAHGHDLLRCLPGNPQFLALSVGLIAGLAPLMMSSFTTIQRHTDTSEERS
jgi:hypothetical protein